MEHDYKPAKATILNLERRISEIQDEIHEITETKKINDKLAALKMDYVDKTIRNFALALLYSGFMDSSSYVDYSHQLYELIENENNKTKNTNDSRTIMYEQIETIKKQISTIDMIMSQEGRVISECAYTSVKFYLDILDESTRELWMFFHS